MLYLGADHNGYFLKEKLKIFLQGLAIAYQDLGAYKFQKSDDYVDFAVKVGRALKKVDLGILICGSGHGMVIAANRLAGVRAAMPINPTSARDGRHDDHLNVVVLAAWETGSRQAEKIVKAFIKQIPGQGKRYLRRLKKIQALEKTNGPKN